MRKALAILMSVSMVMMAWPVALSAQQPGSVDGLALDAGNKPLPQYTIQLRSAETGRPVGSATSDAAGAFTFAGISPGNYIIELVDAAGNILGTATATVTAGVASKVIVVATAAGRAAAAALPAGGLAGLFSGTSLLVITAAAAAGITIAIVAKKKEASPSR